MATQEPTSSNPTRKITVSQLMENYTKSQDGVRNLDTPKRMMLAMGSMMRTLEWLPLTTNNEQFLKASHNVFANTKKDKRCYVSISHSARGTGNTNLSFYTIDFQIMSTNPPVMAQPHGLGASYKKKYAADAESPKKGTIKKSEPEYSFKIQSINVYNNELEDEPINGMRPMYADLVAKINQRSKEEITAAFKLEFEE